MKNGWELKKLKDICLIRPNKKLAKEQLSDDELVSFVPMQYLPTGEKYFTSPEVKTLGKAYSGYVYFEEGDVILAKITPCFENGKLGIARNLNNKIGFGSSEFIVYRCSDLIIPEYLFYFLSQESFRSAGEAVMRGAVGHKRIPKEFYEDSILPIPPLPEQKAIVRLLDRAFAAIDQAQAHLEKNIANAEELFQSKLNEIFSQRGEGWEERKLGDVCENLDRKRVPITKSKREKGPYPYYGASGVVDYVNGYLFDEDLLLVSEDGANLLARTYPIAFSIKGKTWVNNHAHVLRFKNYESQKFVEYYLNSIKLDPYVSGMAQPKLNQRKLNSIPIPFPDLEEQKKALERILSLEEASNLLVPAYEEKLQNLADLKKSLLQKAFAGELSEKSAEQLLSNSKS